MIKDFKRDFRVTYYLTYILFFPSFLFLGVSLIDFNLYLFFGGLCGVLYLICYLYILNGNFFENKKLNWFFLLNPKYFFTLKDFIYITIHEKDINDYSIFNLIIYTKTCDKYECFISCSKEEEALIYLMNPIEIHGRINSACLQVKEVVS